MTPSYIEECLYALAMMIKAYPSHFSPAEKAQVEEWYRFAVDEVGHLDRSEREQIDQMFHSYSYLLI